MKTISSSPSTSLIYWNQNRNGTQLTDINFEDGALALKKFYFDVFNKIAQHLKNANFLNIIPLWHITLNDVIDNNLRPLIRDAIFNHSSNDYKDITERIVNKFRGNCGEIFAEKFFSDNYDKICKNGSYMPVDPNNEKGTDAFAISKFSGREIGIQVKNYRADFTDKYKLIQEKKIDIDVFRTAGYEAFRLMHRLNNELDGEQLKDYMNYESYVIFSFTDVRNKSFIEDTKGSIKFIGPNDIRSVMNIGSFKSSSGNWRFFKDIADEINCLN